MVRTRFNIAHRLQKNIRGTYYRANEAARVTTRRLLSFMHRWVSRGSVVVTIMATVNRTLTVNATR